MHSIDLLIDLGIGFPDEIEILNYGKSKLEAQNTTVSQQSML
jgi:hypothetical protein